MCVPQWSVDEEEEDFAVERGVLKWSVGCTTKWTVAEEEVADPRQV